MKLFGTDGIRGIVNTFITHDLINKVGKSLAKYIIDEGLEKKVLLAKDTRQSGDCILHALLGVLSNSGIDCFVVGIAPTGCVSYLVKDSIYSFGIMITASHSPANYNGIKIFNNKGLKLSDSEEKKLEKNYKLNIDSSSTDKGKIIFDESLVDSYLDNVYKNASNFENLTIAVDSANGANYYYGPLVYTQLCANVIAVGSDKNGVINGGCGAEHVENIVKCVLDNSCDIGFAFDGDADRLRVVLKHGKVLDGDDLLYVFAKFYTENNYFKKPIMVGTVMTNGGLEKALNKLGVKLIRVDVGDKNVINHIYENNLQLGGEPSGHFCNLDVNSSCDALLNSVIFTKIFKHYNGNIDIILDEFTKFSQSNEKIDITDNLLNQLDSNSKLMAEIDDIKLKYENVARIVVRPSGTEPICRVMVESETGEKNNIIMNQLKEIIKKYL